ncbi:hypothetical protein [Occallatibacter savannae]|uniref:hypothetical protein n=1 Tax=Occallatibacter savannae TaxID=1002691 RepID=UPI000D68BB8C|nr:hypothetical protein [Occallatibacter savannae]
MSRARQLRRIRELRLVEEQYQAALLAAGKKQLADLESALHLLRKRQMEGRDLLVQSCIDGDTVSWITALEEVAILRRKADALMAEKPHLEYHVHGLCDRFIAKRIERRQAESILSSVLEEETKRGERQSQATLDEWYRAERRRFALASSGAPDA